MPKNKNVKSKAGIQGFMPVKEIKNNLLFLKDGSAKAILSVTGINYYLMSDDEQDILVSSFQEVINSLEFPIQIVVQSRKVDLNEYLKSLQVAAEAETNPLLQENFFEYITFIKQVMSISSIMDKKFFVVIPYFSDYLANQKKGFLSSLFGSNQHDALPQTSFDKITEVMGQRINSLAFSLQSLGVTAKQLNTQELIELLYGCYNHNLPKIGIQSNEGGEIV